MNWIESIFPFISDIVFAIIVLVVGLLVIKFLLKAIKQKIERSKLDESLKPFVISLISITLKVLLIISVVSILGVATASFAAILAAAGFAIGMAFQGSLSNLAGGILLLTLRPFKVGDYIEGGGYAGTVKGIQILYTELVTPDNKTVFIPNGDLSNSGITNYSSNSTRRVDFVFEVGYETDNQHVIDTLTGVVDAHEAVLKDPIPFIRLSAHGTNAVEYTVRIWVNSEDYWNVYFDVMEQVKIRFDEEGIDIPYPQMNVHLDK